MGQFWRAHGEQVVYLKKRVLRSNKNSCVISVLETIYEFIVRKTVPTPKTRTVHLDELRCVIPEFVLQTLVILTVYSHHEPSSYKKFPRITLLHFAHLPQHIDIVKQQTNKLKFTLAQFLSGSLNAQPQIPGRNKEMPTYIKPDLSYKRCTC